MTVDFNKREKQSMLAVKVGLVTNVFLAVLKTSAATVPRYWPMALTRHPMWPIIW